jgi:hypothetical protein
LLAVVVGKGHAFARNAVNAGTDSGQMEPMVQRIESEQEPLPEDAEYYADGGFASIRDLESVSERGGTIIAPVKAVEKKY